MLGFLKNFNERKYFSKFYNSDFLLLLLLLITTITTAITTIIYF